MSLLTDVVNYRVRYRCALQGNFVGHKMFVFWGGIWEYQVLPMIVWKTFRNNYCAISIEKKLQALIQHYLPLSSKNTIEEYVRSYILAINSCRNMLKITVFPPNAINEKLDRIIVEQSAHTVFYEGINNNEPHGLVDTMMETNMAAVLIQRTWRWCIADPKCALCRKRLMKEFTSQR